MRTTIDIDAPILGELKALQAREGKSMGRLVSELLARALKQEASASDDMPLREWFSKPMKARVDLMDKEALHRALDG
ncbi:MAG: antitoxin [Gammaproteobacteria bacterium]|nr:antitoxin [Gammaproteobacteria bacterium]